MITAKHKNDMMDAYYLMRDQDRALQNMYRYEEEHDLTEDLIVAYIDRKHEITLDILRLLKELGLPSAELEKYVKNHGLGQVKKLTTTDTKPKRGKAKESTAGKETDADKQAGGGASQGKPIFDESKLAQITKYGFYRKNLPQRYATLRPNN